MGKRLPEASANKRVEKAGRDGGRVRLRSAPAGEAAMLAGRCVSGSGAGARRGWGRPEQAAERGEVRCAPPPGVPLFCGLCAGSGGPELGVGLAPAPISLFLRAPAVRL